ncbi:AbrB/MazE/SpoVT family DNA-binding domain-containing protein [Sphingomonas sp.]|jgi:antitoxin VapB|uniref:AbrB/MazE/SpoVT family DNA-binding domain-containing protein n=1 Tax=Sphingomonas sp. TaxID=28214 RepID=UPI002D7FD4C3|nr:AbrB/MazE/SpoVT family DNA-binding domain-containing protein [Sphingomonas sp.]HEU0043538.1 AbrB/MazE/SpoVT family DNA-binding domain-containing protein [Sphingomonas sp.]
MGKQWPARSFKSGNSIAIRVPAALGIEPNQDWTLEERDGELVLRVKEAPKRKFPIDKVWGIGKHLGLKPIASEDRVLRHRPLLRDEDYTPE